MQVKTGELEASLATVTSALQQLSTKQAVHSTPKPPKPDQPHGDRRSGAASNWLHQMTLYLIFLGLLSTAQAVPHALFFLSGAARSWWRAHEASGSPPTTWTPFEAAYLVNQPTPPPVSLGPEPMQLGALTRRPPAEP